MSLFQGFLQTPVGLGLMIGPAIGGVLYEVCIDLFPMIPTNGQMVK